MYYFGVCYCPRKITYCWRDWAWWVINRPIRTYIGDIEERFFLRIFGVEFKVMYWKPKSQRMGQQFPGLYELTAGFATQQERDAAFAGMKGWRAVQFAPAALSNSPAFRELRKD
jgi:hypothetical protein